MKKQTPVSNEVHAKLEAALKEIEQEFIMWQFKYSAPTGRYNNEIRGIPHLGMLTTHSARDPIMFSKIRFGIGLFQRLLRYPPEQVTTRRTAALRQKLFMMRYKNQNIGTYHGSKWSEKSGTYLAGKFLVDIFDSHISYQERKE